MLFYISLETTKVEHFLYNLFYEFLLCLLILCVVHSHVEVRRQLKGVSSLSFHHVHPSCGAQIISLGSICLHLLQPSQWPLGVILVINISVSLHVVLSHVAFFLIYNVIYLDTKFYCPWFYCILLWK